MSFHKNLRNYLHIIYFKTLEYGLKLIIRIMKN
jgi:hypothetical protein